MGTDEEKQPPTLETLNQRLEEVKKLQPKSTPEANVPGDAAKAAIDFASATAVGTALGYGFDVWQNTLPWGILVGLLVGSAAGMKMMFHEMARHDRAESDALKKND